MKRTTIKERFENGFEAFFTDEKLNDSLEPRYSYNTDETDFAESSNSTQNSKSKTNILKQLFLFFPGTFFLFYVSMGTVFFLTDLLTREISISIDTYTKILLILPYLVAFLSIFSTWFGLGDLKKPKHCAIPASIIFTGIFLGIIIKSTENIFFLAERIITDFGYAVYLFPIALIIPFLAKMFVEKSDIEN